MKILLTGGCGYIGTSLTRELLAQGHAVKVVDIQWFGNYVEPHPNLTIVQDDIRNASSWDLGGFDVVMHLANVANDPCSDLNSKLNWEVNALASMFLVERAIKDGVPQFIFASSGSVYGVKEEPEVTEEELKLQIAGMEARIELMVKRGQCIDFIRADANRPLCLPEREI